MAVNYIYICCSCTANPSSRRFSYSMTLLAWRRVSYVPRHSAGVCTMAWRRCALFCSVDRICRCVSLYPSPGGCMCLHLSGVPACACVPLPVRVFVHLCVWMCLSVPVFLVCCDMFRSFFTCPSNQKNIKLKTCGNYVCCGSFRFFFYLVGSRLAVCSFSAPGLSIG